MNVKMSRVPALPSPHKKLAERVYVVALALGEWEKEWERCADLGRYDDENGKWTITDCVKPDESTASETWGNSAAAEKWRKRMRDVKQLTHRWEAELSDEVKEAIEDANRAIAESTNDGSTAYEVMKKSAIIAGKRSGRLSKLYAEKVTTYIVELEEVWKRAYGYSANEE